jgi:hypothetical protein
MQMSWLGAELLRGDWWCCIWGIWGWDTEVRVLRSRWSRLVALHTWLVLVWRYILIYRNYKNTWRGCRWIQGGRWLWSAARRVHRSQGSVWSFIWIPYWEAWSLVLSFRSPTIGSLGSIIRKRQSRRILPILFVTHLLAWPVLRNMFACPRGLSVRT